MTIAFERPIGAHADVKELEYISSLLQTCVPDLRSDGSIVGMYMAFVIDIFNMTTGRFTPKVLS
jgi:hypothetical protein